MMKELSVLILEKIKKGFDVKILINENFDIYTVKIGFSKYCTLNGKQYQELMYWIKN